MQARGDGGGGRQQPIELGVAIGGGVMGEEGRVIRRVLVRAVGSLGLTRSHQGVEVKLVSVPLAVHLGHDVLVVVVAQGATHLVVVHVGF